jgi:hypothetical protein
MAETRGLWEAQQQESFLRSASYPAGGPPLYQVERWDKILATVLRSRMCHIFACYGRSCHESYCSPTSDQNPLLLPQRTELNTPQGCKIPAVSRPMASCPILPDRTASVGMVPPFLANSRPLWTPCLALPQTAF